VKDLQVYALKKLIIKEMASEKNKMEEEIEETKDAAKPCGKLVKEGRQEMLTKADQLLCTISRRREKVASVLEGSASKSDWAAIRRDSTSVSESTGGLASNDSLDHLRSSAEPLLQHFADDLVAVRTKVTLLLSEQDVNLVGDNLDYKENAATKLLRIIKAIESMNQWTSHVMTSWVEYHIHRSQLKGGLDMRGLQEASRDDLCQALALWDIKQGQELRGVLSTLLLHYILLEDIMLEAEGSVAEDPKDCSILHIYL